MSKIEKKNLKNNMNHVLKVTNIDVDNFF